MSYRTKTRRKKPPSPVVFEHRRSWGARLLVELNAIRKDRDWLTKEIGLDHPNSIHQIINGHQGISMEVYQRIVEAVPEMRDVPVLAHFALPDGMKEKQRGAAGIHKTHNYPKLGPREMRRPSL